MNHKSFNSVILKLCITLILMHSFRLDELISNILQNIGGPSIPIIQGIFFYLPSLVVLVLYEKLKSIKLPYLIYFLIFMIYFLGAEYYFFQSDLSKVFEDLPKRILYMYLLFLILYNIDLSYSSFILKRSIDISIVIISLFYFNLFGIFDFISFETLSYEQNRVMGEWNLNVLNDKSIIMLFFYYLYTKHFKRNYTFLGIGIPYFIIILIFVPLIFIAASRGSFLLLIMYFLFFHFENLKLSYFISLLFVLISIFVIIDLSILRDTDILLFDRINQTNFSSIDDSSEGRILQIDASLKNFLESPVFGVGYENAAAGHYFGITRSNFQFSQIIASGGVILFLIYFSMIFKFFANSIKSLKKHKLIRFSLVYILLLSCFRRPEMYFGVLMYFVMFHSLYFNIKNE